MRAIGNRTSERLALRFGATRLCLWRLCGKSACARARACKGDAQICMCRLREWLDAIEAERQLRGSFAPLESELKSLEEARAYLAWRKTLDVAAAKSGTDERTADEFRLDLIRRLHAINAEADGDQRDG